MNRHDAASLDRYITGNCGEDQFRNSNERCQHCDGPIAECGGRTFVKQYRCDCGTAWEDTWCCACNDRCPECGAECEPTSYEEYD